MIKEELNSMFVNLHTWGETLFSFPSMTNCEVVQVSLATWHTWKGSRSTQEPRKPLFRPLTRVSSSIQSKVRCAECDTWHTCPVCPGPRGTPGRDLDRLRSQENLYLDPWHTFIGQSCQKIGFLGVPNSTRVHGHVAHVTMNSWQPSTATSSDSNILKFQPDCTRNKPRRDLRSHPKKWHELILDVDSRGDSSYTLLPVMAFH